MECRRTLDVCCCGAGEKEGTACSHFSENEDSRTVIGQAGQGGGNDTMEQDTLSEKNY